MARVPAPSRWLNACTELRTRSAPRRSPQLTDEGQGEVRQNRRGRSDVGRGKGGDTRLIFVRLRLTHAISGYPGESPLHDVEVERRSSARLTTLDGGNRSIKLARRQPPSCRRQSPRSVPGQANAPPFWYSMTRVSKKFFSFFRSMASLFHGKGFSASANTGARPNWAQRRLAMKCIYC